MVILLLESEVMGKIRVGLVFGVWVFLLLVAVFGVVLNVPLVRGSGTIYIKADGSIDPPTAPISTFDNVTYIFTADIYDSIVVERSNTTIDGKGYTLQGPGSGFVTGFVLGGNVTIQNTNIKGFYEGIAVYSSSNTVSRNNLTNNIVGVYLGSSSSYNSIFENKIANNSGTGIQLYGSSCNIVSGNNITNNDEGINIQPHRVSYDDTIRLASSNNNTLSGNIINNDRHGVSLYDSSLNKIVANNITNNDSGINLYGSSNNTLSGNHLTNNFFHGVSLVFSDDNTINNNHMRNNGYCISLSNSTNNFIFHNDFIYTEMWQHNVSLFGTGYVNIWDVGYPNGGNYWNDYTGIDSFSGPYQNLTGSDGIGDATYVINADNQDRYPLIKPCVVQDMAPPTTTHDYDSLWHTSAFPIILSATDDLTGVRETYYKINDGPTKTISADLGPMITMESANNTLEYWSVDNARNEELPHKILTRIKLDKTRPTALFIIRPTQVFDQRKASIGSIITFDAGASSDNIGILSYEWNFGDGTTKTGIVANHTYTSLGNYTVTLTVRDAAGHTDNFSITIAIVSAEAFPMWIVVGTAIVLAIAVAATILWKKRK